MRTNHRVFCVCSQCEQSYPEESLHPASSLRVMSDGSWICRDCHDEALTDGTTEDAWRDLPAVNRLRVIASILMPQKRASRSRSNDDGDLVVDPLF